MSFANFFIKVRDRSSLALGALVLRPSDSGWNLHRQLSGSQAFELRPGLSCIPCLQTTDCGASQPPRSYEPYCLL